MERDNIIKFCILSYTPTLSRNKNHFLVIFILFLYLLSFTFSTRQLEEVDY